ncbi:hypothetical protein [Pseudonocardia acaciae]|uniref:hypothetical protein n=1 Tax=Pseudonocardia acaciae TaxID=551276 RepID=UPI00048F20F1|nr:hypothetical protein [Pseudonocardia acaciae]
MDLTAASRDWQDRGFAVLPGYLPAEALEPAVSELGLVFPSAQGFHDGDDPRRERYLGDEFAGIDSLPFASTELSLLAVHERLIALARTLLGPELYDGEVSAAGPAGTVVAFELGTFHRGTAVTRPGGARYTMHLSYRNAEAEWGHRHAWAARSHERAWRRFVERAAPDQLALFGFPLPGHPYWTPETLAGVALRYPGLDLSPWRARAPRGTH